MELERPDLADLPDNVVAYIEALEALLAKGEGENQHESSKPFVPDEPPTTLNVVTISAGGLIKRTPRHLYGIQRRGGMGVFDLETAADDAPALLAVADEQASLLLFSDLGRAFRLEIKQLAETAVRDKGQPLSALLPLRPRERLVVALPADAGTYVTIVSERGWVRRIRHNYVGKSLIPGMSFHDIKEGGYLTGACWSHGEGDLLVVTRDGKGIRFAERHVSQRGCLGIRLSPTESAVGITAVAESSGVFVLGNDGKGTIRQMEGFAANKAPGAGGKVLMKTDDLIAVLAVEKEDDLFIISRLGKIIRFPADEVPPKTGVVQGVNCMALRNDVATAVVKSRRDHETPHLP